MLTLNVFLSLITKRKRKSSTPKTDEISNGVPIKESIEVTEISFLNYNTHHRYYLLILTSKFSAVKFLNHVKSVCKAAKNSACKKSDR